MTMSESEPRKCRCREFGGDPASPALRCVHRESCLHTGYRTVQDEPDVGTMPTCDSCGVDLAPDEVCEHPNGRFCRRCYDCVKPGEPCPACGQIVPDA
jgi:hypothetical protein